MDKAVDCQYVMNISQIVENDPGTVRRLRTWGGGLRLESRIQG